MKWIGPHVGRFSQKLIWSPWLQRLYIDIVEFRKLSGIFSSNFIENQTKTDNEANIYIQMSHRREKYKIIDHKTNQGDQIRRIFAHWMIVYFRQFLEIDKSIPYF
jgi:hypothetical protein